MKTRPCASGSASGGSMINFGGPSFSIARSGDGPRMSRALSSLVGVRVRGVVDVVGAQAATAARHMTMFFMTSALCLQVVAHEGHRSSVGDGRVSPVEMVAARSRERMVAVRIHLDRDGPGRARGLANLRLGLDRHVFVVAGQV